MNAASCRKRAGDGGRPSREILSRATTPLRRVVARRGFWGCMDPVFPKKAPRSECRQLPQACWGRWLAVKGDALPCHYSTVQSSGEAQILELVTLRVFGESAAQ